MKLLSMLMEECRLGDNENFASKSDCEEFSDEFSMLWARIDNDCDFFLERGRSMSFVYQNKASEARKKEQDSLSGLPAIEGLRQAISAQGYITLQKSL